MENKPRRLKVARVGDFYKKKTKPFLSLQGLWLEKAGIPAESHVQVSNPRPGVLIIQKES